MKTTVEDKLLALERLDTTGLRAKWEAVTETPPPQISPILLRLALAYRLQENTLTASTRKAHASQDAALKRVLEGQASKSAIGGASKLVRDWQGTTHIVTIDEAGTIRWNNRAWKSLSAVARAITGTHWSGPAFFGVRERDGVQRKVKP